MSDETFHPTAPQLTGDDLAALLATAAGPAAPGDNGFLDTEFELLGYDSLARLETAALIRARYGLKLPDDIVVEANTPGELLTLTNRAFADASA